MNGDKQVLDVYLDGEQIAHIGIFEDQLSWSYSENWNQKGYPISPHLPLESEIPSIHVQRFLKNLLPEGSALDELVYNFHLSKNNIFGLIQKLGLDTPGSLIILRSEEAIPEIPKFRLIKESELEDRLTHRDVYGLIIWDGKPRLSVAGVQDKINVVLNRDNALGFGEGSLCSTHILKFERQKYSHLVLNEYFSMYLARECGLEVAEVGLKRFGPHPALLVRRFDRKLDLEGTVKRRHIIDGCQALNLPPEYKYEQNFGSGRDVAHIRDGASLAGLFNFANHCVNPAVTKLHILDWALFNALIFNSDAHGKNISFFVNEQGYSLAPFYDLVNIKMYSEFEHQLAMAFGDEFDENNINAYQLADFAQTCGLSRSLVIKRLNLLVTKLKASLQKGFGLLFLDGEERDYLIRYQEMISKQCNHFLEQINLLPSVKL